jgi:hypothetical protein
MKHLLALAALPLAFAASQAQAVTTVGFTGTVAESIGGIAPIGATYSGSFSYDPSAPFETFGPSTILYTAASNLGTLSVTIGGETYTGQLVGSLSSDSSSGVGSEICFDCDTVAFAAFLSNGGADQFAANLSFISTDNSLVDLSGLPTVFPSFESFDFFRRFALNDIVVGGVITGGLQQAAVPEPAAFALLGLGIVGIVAARRRGTGAKA